MTQAFYKEVKGYLDNIKPEVLAKSLNNVHADGLFSLVIEGDTDGYLTRVFIATKKIKQGQIQLQSHRYGLNLAVLRGSVRQHVAILKPNCNVKVDVYKYRSPLNGGTGANYATRSGVMLDDFNIPEGFVLTMGSSDIHTISCSKGAMWVVQEKGFDVESSTFIGVPFITDNLYTEPLQYQINDMYQRVLKEVRRIVSAYESVEGA